MIAHWMGYALLVSAALAAVALAVDHALRLYGRPTRWLWATSLLGAVVVPVLAFLRAPVPHPVSDIGVPLAMPAMLPGSVAAATPVSPLPAHRVWLAALVAHGDDVLLGCWLVATLLLVTWAVVSYLRLRRERQAWHEREVDGLKVLVSESAGPAVVGLRRSRVVLPAWVLSEPELRRRMIVTHEAEHVAAGDPQLLATACGVLLLAPWNPLVWWQLRRLRLAAELDCDARVLRHGMDLRGYAGLLLDVGERFGRAPLAAAFAEPRSVLARRLAALTARKPARRALRAAGGAMLALAIVGIAGATPLPQRPALRLALGMGTPGPSGDASLSRSAAKEKHTVVVIDSAGNYYVGEFSDEGNSGGTDVPECAAARRITPEGQAACDSRLVGLIKESLARNPDRGVVYTRVSPGRPYQEVVHVMEVARRAGASMAAALTDAEASGLKVVKPPTEDGGAPPPAAGQVKQEKTVVLEILPGPRYQVNGEAVKADELTPYLRKLYANRAQKVIFVKADGQVLYRDVIAGMDAARAAGIKVIGATLPGGVKVTGGEIVPTPPPPPPPPPGPGAPGQLPPAPKPGQLPPPAQPPVPPDLERLSQQPTFTPYTVPPELVNREEVRKALQDNYPPLLRAADVGGTIVIWELLDTQGQVLKAAVKTSSGRQELDSAALKVGRTMRFTAARNGDQPTPVWIQLPIIFRTANTPPDTAFMRRNEAYRRTLSRMVPDLPVNSSYGIPGLPEGYTPPREANADEIRKITDEVYPQGMQSQGNWAWLILSIDATGKVTSHELRPSGDPALDRAANAIAEKIRFAPAKDASGNPAAVRIGMPLMPRHVPAAPAPPPGR